MDDYDTSHEEIMGLLDQARAKLLQLRFLYSCKVETEYRVPPPYEKTEEEIFPDNEP
jgi:hypothetical protein